MEIKTVRHGRKFIVQGMDATVSKAMFRQLRYTAMGARDNATEGDEDNTEHTVKTLREGRLRLQVNEGDVTISLIPKGSRTPIAVETIDSAVLIDWAA
ncbi:hypothetical protein [Leucobacter chromiireducens]|uniref:hypothetical protein n=1 Tax=Leucobacter chromiireducens TaxID=283877 RepID=UPI000F63B7C1|nr:hypothetical protein [Leucobacter chromiireducens]